MTLRPFFESRQSLIQKDHLCKNSNAKLVDFLEVNPDKIYWYALSANPAAMSLLLQNPDKIYWPFLAENPHPDAIALLATNKSRLTPKPQLDLELELNPWWRHSDCWYELSKTCDARTLEKNEEKINWFTVWENPDIFEPNNERYVLK